MCVKYIGDDIMNYWVKYRNMDTILKTPAYTLRTQIQTHRITYKNIYTNTHASTHIHKHKHAYIYTHINTKIYAVHTKTH